MSYTIRCCGRVFDQYRMFNLHLGDAHFDREGKCTSNSNYPCPFDQCNNEYKYKNSLLHHFKYFHQIQLRYNEVIKSFELKIIDPNLVRVQRNPIEDLNVPEEFPELNDLNDFLNQETDSNASNSILPSPNLLRPYQPRAIDSLQQFVVNLNRTKLQSRISDKSSKEIANCVLLEIKDLFATNQLTMFKIDEFIKLVSSTYHQRQKLDEVLDVVDFVHEFEFDHGGKFEFIDLRRSLTIYLSNQEIRDAIWNEKNATVDPNIYNSFRSTGLFNEEVNKTINLYLQIYFDDFHTGRVRGSTNTKMSVVYLTLPNLPYAKQSKRDQILLSLVCKRSDLKNRQDLERFFGPLVNAINELNADLIQTEDGFEFKIIVSSVVGDNLATNELQGICRSFRWNACKYCEIWLEQINEFNVQRVRANDRILDDCDHICKDVAYRGILYAPDIFHDLNEGVIPIIVNAVLKKMSLEQRKLVDHQYRNQFKNLKNGLLKGIIDSKISGTGVQKYDFFVLLSILNVYVSKNSDLWKLYVVLRRIVNFCYSTKIQTIDLDDFESECILFNRQFSTIFNSSNTPFKVHHISHYAKLIRCFGPLFFLSTLRYERVHQLLIRLVCSSLNFSSLFSQIARRWSTLFLINQRESKSEELDVYEIYEPFQIEENVDERLFNFIDHTIQLTILNKIIIDDLVFEKNDIFLYDYYTSSKNPLPAFVNVCQIVKQDESIKIIGKLFGSVNYYENICCFQVRSNETLFEINPKRIKSHLKVRLIRDEQFGLLIQDEIYIPYDHYFSYTNHLEFSSNNNENLDVVFDEVENDDVEHQTTEPNSN